MKSKIRKFIIGGAMGIVVFRVVTSTILYDIFKKATKSLPIEFDNWGGEYLYD
jgi:hypothetical protein